VYSLVLLLRPWLPALPLRLLWPGERVGPAAASREGYLAVLHLLYVDRSGRRQCLGVRARLPLVYILGFNDRCSESWLALYDSHI
jgi:hypothetical protein